MAVLASLLSNHGIVPDSIGLQPELPTRMADASPSRHVIRRLASPDTPPPRA
jgi:hypothetical protein